MALSQRNKSIRQVVFSLGALNDSQMHANGAPSYIKNMWLTGYFLDSASGVFDDLRVTVRGNGVENLQDIVYVPNSQVTSLGGNELYLVGYGKQQLQNPLPVFAKPVNTRQTNFQVTCTRWDGTALPAHTQMILFFNVEEYDPVEDPTSRRRVLGSPLDRAAASEF